MTRSASERREAIKIRAKVSYNASTNGHVMLEYSGGTAEQVATHINSLIAERDSALAQVAALRGAGDYVVTQADAAGLGGEALDRMRAALASTQAAASAHDAAIVKRAYAEAVEDCTRIMDQYSREPHESIRVAFLEAIIVCRALKGDSAGSA